MHRARSRRCSVHSSRQPPWPTRRPAWTEGLGQAFVAEVRKLRGTRLSDGADIASGEVWLGPDARALGLVDEIGTLEEVIRNDWHLNWYDFGPRRGGGLLSVEATGELVGVVLERMLSRTFPQFR